MTLNEAISHAREKAEELKKDADYIDAPYGMDTSARTQCLECAEEHEQLADWLEELKERRKFDRWIPVSERLPEKYGYYLVTTDESHNAVIDIAEYGKFFRKPENEYVLGWNKASRVIAWQPLPEPYKKGGAK